MTDILTQQFTAGIKVEFPDSSAVGTTDITIRKTFQSPAIKRNRAPDYQIPQSRKI
ncbi:hypothetical protein [Belliella aquatica]|uniref:hypothetical protein n=1 Tax=Belliella aquatica TaxID=1323734 RepID=UPI001667558A|nr:hypothetical protein [Belliella aquatica]MCH7407283.1 hypothetical protein [Belliella aquatica]